MLAEAGAGDAKATYAQVDASNELVRPEGVASWAAPNIALAHVRRRSRFAEARGHCCPSTPTQTEISVPLNVPQKFLVRPEGVEPPTPWSEAMYSIH